MDFEKEDLTYYPNFQVIKEIGSGAYGKVFQAVDKRSKEDVALKVVFVMKGESLDTYQREIDVLAKLHHKNVVEFLDCETAHRKDKSGMTFAMSFELCSADMQQILSEMDGTRLPLNTIKNISHQLLEGLQYLHQNHVLHRDLKMQNLLVTASGTLKIADFGLARFERPEKNYTPGLQTLSYRAPEVLLLTTSYGPAMDMWSVGCIIAGILIGRVFIKGTTELKAIKHITYLLGTITQERLGGLDLPLLKCMEMPKYETPKLQQFLTNKIEDEDAVDLISRLVCLNPNDRLDCTDALSHPFLAPGEDSYALSTSALLPTAILTSANSTSAAAQSSCSQPRADGVDIVSSLLEMTM